MCGSVGISGGRGYSMHARGTLEAPHRTSVTIRSPTSRHHRHRHVCPRHRHRTPASTTSLPAGDAPRPRTQPDATLPVHTRDHRREDQSRGRSAAPPQHTQSTAAIQHAARPWHPLTHTSHQPAHYNNTKSEHKISHTAFATARQGRSPSNRHAVGPTNRPPRGGGGGGGLRGR